MTLFTLEMVNAPMRVPDPMLPPKLILPVPAASVKLLAPSMVEAKLISPAPAPVFKVADPDNVIGLAKEMVLLLVVMFPAKCTAPAPVCVKVPSIVLVLELPKVMSPEFVRDTGPVLVVVKPPLIVKVLPVKVMPAAVFVFNVPVIVVKPVTLAEIDAAVILFRVKLVALVTTKAPKRVTLPTLPGREIVPVPGVRVRFCDPFNVLLKAMLPPELLSTTGFINDTGPSKVILLLGVEILMPRLTGPVPV